LLLVIFLVSLLALEGILRHDEALARQSKRLPIPPAPPLRGSTTDASGMNTSSVLILANAIEQHSRGARRPIALEPSPAGFSLHTSDPAIDPVPQQGPGR